MCQKRCEAFVVTNCQFVSCAVDVKLHITCVYEYMRMTYCIYSLYSALYVLYLLYAFRVRRYILNLSLHLPTDFVCGLCFCVMRFVNLKNNLMRGNGQSKPID